MDIVTIDWFSGMHTDKQDKYGHVYTKEYIKKITKYIFLLKHLLLKIFNLLGMIKSYAGY